MIQVFLAAVAQEPAGRRGQPGARRRLPRAGGLRGRRQALAPVRQALSQEHLPRQLPVQRGAGRLPPRRVRPGDRGGRDDRRGDLQGRRTASTSPARTSGRRSTSSARSTTPAASPPGRWTTTAGRRPVHRRRRRDQVAHAQGPEAPRGLGGPTGPAGGGRRRGRTARDPGAGPRRGKAPGQETAGAKLDYRNIAEVDVKVYPVDLMRLYLTRRNLDGIAGIDLAGITPFYSADDQARRRPDFDDKARADRPPAEGRGLPRDGPRRQPLRLGDRAGLAAGDGGARGGRQRPGPRDRPRRARPRSSCRRSRSR